MMQSQKKALTLPLTLSNESLPIDNPPVPPSDLAEITLAWPSVPEHVKAAVKAMFAPYLKPEGGK